MSDIGIKGFISKNIDEIDNIANSFIKASLNIREGICREKDADKCMLALIRDTYMCNVLLRYVGMMSQISSDPKWESIDNKLFTYAQDYYINEKFKKRLIQIHEFYLNTYEDENINYDYCKFLDKMISKSEISKNTVMIRKTIKMIENRILNVLNVNPIVKIATKYFKKLPTQYEIIHDKVIVTLNQTNYLNLIDLIDDMNVRHQIEKQYMSRTKNVLVDFSKLILFRNELARQSNFSTFFKYINRDKHDNSDTIKELITELNQKLNKKTQIEINKIHQFFTRSLNHRLSDSANTSDMKIYISDIIKYNKIHKNNTLFDPKHVFRVIFYILNVYFNIKIQKTNEITWRNNVIMYNLLDSDSGNLLGRLYLDIFFDDNKKINNPISVRLSDKMQININSKTIAEVSLLANYHNTKCMTYDDVILLFREFGYIINGVCYDSRVGLINYDEEFSNYLPILMEYIASDRDTIRMIVGDADVSIIDHIEMGKYIDLCFNIKLKCINAKFDHLLHNSEPLIQILMNADNKNGDASIEILETYKDVYKDIMTSLSSFMFVDPEFIDPLVIIQEINNFQGVLYANLMNEMFAYTTFWIIKEKKANDFRNCVLSNGVNNYRELVRTFLKKIDTNCFTLYIKNVIKTDDIEDYMTEDTNYFDDNEYDSESDKDAIIQINRIR